MALATVHHEEETRTYELSFLVASEDTAPLSASLAVHSVTPLEMKPLEKVRLAYPIGKQSYAFLGSVRFTASGDLAALSNEIKLHGGTLRFFLKKFSPHESNFSSRPPRRPMSGTTEATTSPTEALTNEALEKKISEILQ
jgi:ribosomal protein S6